MNERVTELGESIAKRPLIGHVARAASVSLTPDTPGSVSPDTTVARLTEIAQRPTFDRASVPPKVLAPTYEDRVSERMERDVVGRIVRNVR